MDKSEQLEMFKDFTPKGRNNGKFAKEARELYLKLCYDLQFGSKSISIIDFTKLHELYEKAISEVSK